MIHTIIKYLLISTTLFFCSCHKPKTDIITPAKQLIERQIGERAQSIHFEYIEPSDGKDIFEVIASDGRLTLRGSSSVAICYAFHTYMKEACKSMKTWSGEHITSVMPWPDYELYEQVSPYELRYFLNVCTFGYTTPYWDWERWEKEIDRMALYGVNMPLATVASEAIAERVWLRMGLNKEEIREFFTAPAHLPWHRMGNLNKWDGPLSDAWQQNQIALQHQILTRMRELGMQPIAPAFAGFVPEGFVQKHPDTQFRHMRWGGFDEEYNAYVLPPDSPFFEEIGKLFVEEWEKEFGENTYYLSDSFNEMELPIDKEDKEAKYKLLAEYGETIYKSIAAGNPDAVWVTQGWTFGYQHSFWDKESLKALLSNVPDDKMIIIDLGNDYPKWVWNTEQTWKVHDGFYGKKWIFSYVPNFGGKNIMTGDLDMYASSSVKALRAANKGNLIGFGSAPEGLENNEVVYELLADMGWSSDSIDLDDWMKIYCEARYGGYPDAMEEAWKLFRKTAGSLIYMDEDLDEAAQRVLNELTGLKNVNLMQFKAFGSKNRTKDPRDVHWLERAMQSKVERIVTIAYLSLVKIDRTLNRGLDEYMANWVALPDIKALAFDHNLIIKEAITYIRQYIEFNPSSLFDLLPRKFTASQLRTLYELLYGKQIDVRNFHKKIALMEYVVPLEEKQQGVAHRAARYYRFDKKIYNKVRR